MKSLLNKLLLTAILFIALDICAFAQTRSREHDLSPFEGIEASSGFKVSIVTGDRYSAKLTMDDILESYVLCYVKSGVLYLGLDEKNLPKDIKKQYKTRNSSDPTLVAVVTMPLLKSLSLNDDSEFFAAGQIAAEYLQINLNGSSVANNLKIAGKSLSVTAARNAKFTNATVTAEEDVNITADAKSAVAIQCKAKNVVINGAGMADIDVNAEAEEAMKVMANTNVKMSLSGKSSQMEVTGKGTMSKVDASALETEKATVSVTGITVYVGPTKSLELDLGRGSEVGFAGEPAVNIIKIQSSTVTRR